ncbi:hypothetical protein PAXINDRAFT_18067 [Paxillus involutus ATCC 200175]|uniref:Uncharacterized protein n=1 Tax=Paxillus involutus ATCC 200175 TaxID=664439 RepID=A0A0C9SPA5_PAXIN|nr:hypothetical protein PAXINDRAFT_18067 [Paxillus involutus ATCC 200175]
MSAMVNLEVLWIKIMSKTDLVSLTPSSSDPSTTKWETCTARRCAIPGPYPLLLANARDGHDKSRQRENGRFCELTLAIVQLIEDHPLVPFLPLDVSSTESVEMVNHIDFMLQCSEDEEPKEPHDLDEDDFADMEQLKSSTSNTSTLHAAQGADPAVRRHANHARGRLAAARVLPAVLYVVPASDTGHTNISD